MSGCSPGVDYPSLFPAVHDMPPPRADTPLDSEQIQQATEDLVAARNRLNAEAPQSAQDKANASSQPAARKKPPAAGSQGGAAAAAPPATTGSTQTAGAATKP
jgi:hypothetical protein